MTLLTMEERAALSIVQALPDFKVLTRFASVDRYAEDVPDMRLGVVVDTETTGLESDAAIIEIGIVLFSYSPRTKTIHAIVDSYSGMQDPGFPIPENITQVTGITTADVAGQSIDWTHVEELVSLARFAIAHNAGFDRPLLEKQCAAFANIPWACSLNDIDWSANGIGSAKLDYIAYKLGFFFEGHRAENDCRALLHALTHTLPEADVSLFGMMALAAAQTTFRVWATGAPFDAKDALKASGYRWNDGTDGRPKAWNKDVVGGTLLAQERAWLLEKVYTQRSDLTIPVETITAFLRYSARRGEVRPMNELITTDQGADQGAAVAPAPPVPVAVETAPAPPPAPVATLSPAPIPQGQGSLWGNDSTGAAVRATPPRG